MHRRFGQGFWWRFRSYKHIGQWYGDEAYWDEPEFIGQAGWVRMYLEMCVDPALRERYVRQPDQLREDIRIGKHLLTGDQYRTLDDLIAWRRSAFAEGAVHGVAQTTYYRDRLNVMIALKEYPDEIVYDPTSETAYLGNNEPVCLMYTGQRFGRDSCRQVSKLFNERTEGARSYTMDGIGHDGKLGFQKYRLPDLSRSQGGLAWDEEGPFELTGVAHTRHFEQLRGVTRADGTRVAIVGHAEYTYHIALHQDVFLHEADLWRDQNGLDRRRLRLITGSKPQVCHGHQGHDTAGRRIPWQTMSPEAIRDYYRDLADWQLLWAVRDGTVLPIDDVLGIPKVAAFQPFLLEANRLGFQAAPGVRTSHPRVVPSRFGKGLGALIGLGNHAPESVTFEAAVDNLWLGGGTVLLSDYAGRPVACTFSGEQTRFNGSLERYSPAAYRVQMRVLPDGLTGTGSVEQRSTREGLELRAQLALDRPRRVALAVYVPPGVVPVRVVLNDTSVAFEQRGREVFFKSDEPVEAARVTVVMQSTVFAGAWRDYLDFPFVGDDETLATVLYPESTDYADFRAARRIQEYFRFWYAEGADEARTVELPMRTQYDSAVPGALVVLGSRLPEGLVAPPETGQRPVSTFNVDGRPVLWIRGATAAERESLTVELLDLLDTRYPFTSALNLSGKLDPATRSARVKADLAGKPLLPREPGL